MKRLPAFEASSFPALIFLLGFVLTVNLTMEGVPKMDNKPNTNPDPKHNPQHQPGQHEQGQQQQKQNQNPNDPQKKDPQHQPDKGHDYRGLSMICKVRQIQMVICY